MLAWARSTSRFRFRFVGQVPIDETSAAAAAGRQILGLWIGLDDELGALAARTAQKQWFHEGLAVMEIMPSIRKKQSTIRKKQSTRCTNAPFEDFTGVA
ncbi:MAG TPA: hypothetical protein VGC55_05440 [Dokdonella sp.]